MRAIFMGTPDFSVPTLEAMIEAGHDVIGVFTQPDKAKGRGKSVSFTPVKETALAHDIPVYQPAKVRAPEVLAQIEAMAPDVIVVVAFGQILPKALLDIPKYGCINGEAVSGVTTMYMAEGIDTGDMILKEEIVLDAKETGGSLHDKLSVSGAALLVKTLAQIEEGTAPRVAQDDSQAGDYAKMLDKHMGNLDFSKPAAELEQLIRGLNPWPSAYTRLGKKTVKIWDADVSDKEYEGEYGEITEVTKDAFTVKTGKGSLIVRELQMEGKKRMYTDAFLRGVTLNKGDKFSQE